MFHLSCTEGGVELRLPDGNKVLIESLEDLVDRQVEWNTTRISCSSSMDFPEESTSDLKVLALCDEIMNDYFQE